MHDKEAAQKLAADLKASGGPYCNFCGTDEPRAGHLVAGPAVVYICWQCADSALEVIKSLNAKKP